MFFDTPLLNKLLEGETMAQMKDLERFFNCTFLVEDEEQLIGGHIKFIELQDELAFIGFIKDEQKLVLVLEANGSEMTTLEYNVDYACREILRYSYLGGVFELNGFITEQNREDYRIAKEKHRLQEEQEKQEKERNKRYQTFLVLKKEFEGEKA